MYVKGLAYNTIGRSRSAIAQIIVWEGFSSIADHPYIRKYMKGVYNLRPTLPRYTAIWDINTILQYYKGMPDNINLSFEQITRKTVMLLLILSFQRKQTIKSIHRKNVLFLGDKLVLLPNLVLKHTRQNNPLMPVEYDRFTDKKLCIIECMKIYYDIRNDLASKDTEQLIITSKKPYGPASADTIARWIKRELRSAGIDIKTYKAHSTRAASSSKAKQKGVSVGEILKKGRWGSSTTFKKHYDKHIVNNSVENVISGNIIMD